MKVFKTDAPKFFTFKIEGSEKVYRIPLAKSLTNKQLKAFEQTKGEYYPQVEWLRGFLGDMVDDITPEIMKQIILTWSDASSQSGASVGESSASDA